MKIKIFSIIYAAGVFLQANSQRAETLKDEDKIHLYHYSNSQNSSERYDISDPATFKYGRLVKGIPIKIIVHGAGSSCFKFDFPTRTIQAYLRRKMLGKEDYNVLCLDYEPLSQLGPVPGELLPSIRKSYEYVGNLVAEKAANIILSLETDGYVSNLDQIHLIGHSLGGQISGFIGRKIQEKTNYERKVGRITGLDIANLFLVLIYNNEVTLTNQLDLSDADFVDIIHTSPIGLKGDYGHADFYPDGGLHQISCLTRGPVSNVTELLIGTCSHMLVGKYWENSIDNPNITACKDNSWESFQKRKEETCKEEDVATFGEFVQRSARGKYYLEYPRITPD